MLPLFYRKHIAAFLRFLGKTSNRKKRAFTRVHQAIFVVFLLCVALFSRGNQYLEYPQIIYVFLAFLLSNAATNYVLTKYNVYSWMVDLMVVWNCVNITGLLYYSGGLHSYLWVLYLLPIFTAAILLDTRQLALTLFLALVGNAVFYGNPFTDWDFDVGFELAGKSAVIFLGAMLMKSLASEREKVEEELENEREKLDKMSFDVAKHNLSAVENADMVEMGKKTAGVVHDLGTPVTVIIGSARILMEDENPSKTDVQRILDAALLCRNILKGAMQVAKGQEYNHEEITMRDPLESAMAIAAPVLAADNVTLSHIFRENIPRIRGSQVHLERLFLNLMMNAKHELKDGGEVRVLLTVPSDRKAVEVTIEDNGPGFAKEMLRDGPRPFATSRSETGGTGLGLVVCKEIVEKHGGEFKLSNRVLGGARVYMKFPAVVPGAVQGQNEQANMSAPKASL
ncbi:MAG: HAMP domain-containing sensor histidine kinase [Elusimicrobiales bacterium]|nr:HAMP domain-containing sensor histidine kinase [Elusimicrobiales bacterium]